MGFLGSLSPIKRVAFIGFVALCAVGGVLLSQSRQDGRVTQALEQMVEQLQPQLPIELDEVTTWTRVTADGNTLSYHYVLDGSGAALGDVEANRPSLVSAACSDPTMVEGLNQGVRFAYVYEAADGAPLGTIAIEEADCAA